MNERRKNKWTKEEEVALLSGITKHGAGKWTEILKDPDFAAQLVDRTNVNLKDKWRNLKRSVTSVVESASISTVVSNEPCLISSSDESRYDAIVLEAISTINDEYGSDLSEILTHIKERYEVPQKFTKLLTDSLRILVSQGKLEKVVNRYKISSEVKNKELEVAAEEAARRIAESDNKMFIAVEAVKKAQQIFKMAEESKMMLQICLEIQEKCERGEKVYLENLFFD